MSYNSLAEAMVDILKNNKDMTDSEVHVFVALYTEADTKFNRTTLGKHLGYGRDRVARALVSLTARGLVQDSAKTIKLVYIVGGLQIRER